MKFRGQNIRVDPGKVDNELMKSIVYCCEFGYSFILHDGKDSKALFDPVNLTLTQSGYIMKYKSLEDFQDGIKFGLFHHKKITILPKQLPDKPGNNLLNEIK